MKEGNSRKSQIKQYILSSDLLFVLQLFSDNVVEVVQSLSHIIISIKKVYFKDKIMIWHFLYSHV